MKFKFLLIAAIAIIFTGCSHKPKDFSGTWVLDKQSSQYLPHSSDNVDKYTLTVQETGDSLTMLIEFTGMGTDNVLGPHTYPLNGKQVYIHDSLRGLDSWRQVERSDDSDHLVLLTRQIQNFGGQVTMVQDTSIWSMPSQDKLQIESHVAGLEHVQVRNLNRE
ncbi:MAG TPA: hypothetical protein VFA55_01890 [Candidatus Kapabacteria bacterium]|nr:hypothetical protein [Candidatus Kapabacteria bacterium]